MFLAEIGKFVGAKVAAAVIFIAVTAGGLWCWQHPEEVRAFGRVIKLALIWIAVAAALPWTSFVFIRPLLGLQSNMQSATSAAILSVGFIAAYWLVDVGFAFYLADWSVSGALSWIVLILGLLAAGAYNFVICESLARHVDR